MGELELTVISFSDMGTYESGSCSFYLKNTYITTSSVINQNSIQISVDIRAYCQYSDFIPGHCIRSP